MVHASLQARRVATTSLQDGRRHLACGLSGRCHHLLRLWPMAEPAPHTAAHAGLHGGDGHADDLRDHASYDAPVLFLALSGPQVEFTELRSAKASFRSATHFFGALALPRYQSVTSWFRREYAPSPLEKSYNNRHQSHRCHHGHRFWQEVSAYSRDTRASSPMPMHTSRGGYYEFLVTVVTAVTGPQVTSPDEPLLVGTS